MSLINTEKAPKYKEEKKKIVLVEDNTDDTTEKNGIVKFFSSTETIGKEVFLNGYSEDS